MALNQNHVTDVLTATTGNGSFSGFNVNFATNRLVNPFMSVDQANEGASVTLTSGAYKFVSDQWQAIFTQTGAAGSTTAQTVVDSPSTLPGGKSLKFAMGTGHATSAGDFGALLQDIEAVNTTDLAFGTSSASPISLSFWVKTSLTGATFTAAIMNNANNRTYLVNFSVPSAATWTRITLPNIPGDTTGTWQNETFSTGLEVTFCFGAGSTFQGTAGAWQAGNFFGTSATTNLMATTGATFQITGVQLEPGTVCTPLERRPIAQELMICQRYYSKTFSQGTAPSNFGGFAGSLEGCRSVIALTAASPVTWSYEPIANWSFPVEMRAVPSITLYNPVSGSAGQWSILTANARALSPGTRGVIIDNGGVGVAVANNVAVGQIFIAATADARL